MTIKTSLVYNACHIIFLFYTVCVGIFGIITYLSWYNITKQLCHCKNMVTAVQR